MVKKVINQPIIINIEIPYFIFGDVAFIFNSTLAIRSLTCRAYVCLYPMNSKLGATNSWSLTVFYVAT